MQVEYTFDNYNIPSSNNIRRRVAVQQSELKANIDEKSSIDNEMYNDYQSNDKSYSRSHSKK